MLTTSDFMQQLRTYAQNPQGSSRGTQWTLLGSSTLQGVSCDLTVHPASALYMDSWFKIVYVSPCYEHGDMLNDNASSHDARVYYCDNCTKEYINSGEKCS